MSRTKPIDLSRLKVLPLIERKKILRKSVKWSDRMRWTEMTREKGRELLRNMCKRQGEGIIAKRIDRSYIGGRSDAWLDDFVARLPSAAQKEGEARARDFKPG